MWFRVRALTVNQETGLVEIPANWIPLRYDAIVDQTGQYGTPGAYVYQIVALEPVQIPPQASQMQMGQMSTPTGGMGGMPTHSQPGPVMQPKRDPTKHDMV